MPPKAGSYSFDVEVGGAKSYRSGDPVGMRDNAVDVHAEMVLGVRIGKSACEAHYFNHMTITKEGVGFNGEIVAKYANGKMRWYLENVSSAKNRYGSVDGAEEAFSPSILFDSKIP